jgi:sec-independent protein translocase protein TatB
MMDFGPVKVVFTLIAALLILGPKRLPDAYRSLRKALGQLRQASHEVTDELRSELDAGAPESLPPAIPGNPPATRPLSGPLAGPAPAPAAGRAHTLRGPRNVPPADEEELRPGPR